MTVPYQPATETSSNREGIYFVNTDTQDKYAGIVEKATVAKKSILTPVAPKEEGFVMDGKTPNTIKNADLGDVVFTVNGEELTKSGGKEGVGLVKDYGLLGIVGTIKKQTLKSQYSEVTHEEVAQDFNLTRMGVVQIEKRAMEKFKKAMAQKNIKLKDLL